MGQQYSIGGKLVSKEEWEAIRFPKSIKVFVEDIKEEVEGLKEVKKESFVTKVKKAVKKKSKKK